MRQNVVAGKTPVGTKVEAKLTIATLVKGTVIPEGAVFSGEVVDSVAKSGHGAFASRHSHGFGALEEGIQADESVSNGVVLPDLDGA